MFDKFGREMVTKKKVKEKKGDKRVGFGEGITLHFLSSHDPTQPPCKLASPRGAS